MAGFLGSIARRVATPQHDGEALTRRDGTSGQQGLDGGSRCIAGMGELTFAVQTRDELVQERPAPRLGCVQARRQRPTDAVGVEAGQGERGPFASVDPRRRAQIAQLAGVADARSAAQQGGVVVGRAFIDRAQQALRHGTARARAVHARVTELVQPHRDGQIFGACSDQQRAGNRVDLDAIHAPWRLGFDS